KNAVLNINLNGHKLDGQTAESLKVDVTADKTLNINGGGETAAGIITEKVNFDVADGGALVFDGKTEFDGEINNAANGNVVNAKSGILELKGEIENAGTITNKAEGDSLGRMTITDGGVTGTGKIVNNGQLLVGAAIENDLHNVTTGSTVSQLLIKEGNTVSGDLYNGNAEAENAYGLVDIQDAGDLGDTDKKVYNYGGYINIEKGTLTRDVVNDEGALFIGTNGEATIKGNISQSEPLPEEADPTTYICGNVKFSGDGKEISNSVHVVKSTIIQGFVPHYNDDFTNIPAVEAGYTGIFTIDKGTVTGDVEVDNEAELYNKVSGVISGFVKNMGTMETKADGITGHTAVDYTGENKNVGVQNLNSLTLYSGELGTCIMDVDSGDLKGTTYIASGGTVTNGTKNYTITQKSLVVESSGSLTTDVDVIHIGTKDVGPIVNDGILSFTADGSGNGQYSDETVDTLQEKVTNTSNTNNGTLNFGVTDGTNTFHALGDIMQNVVNVYENLIMDAKLVTTETVGETNVADEKYLKIAAGNLQSEVNNGSSSIVKLTAGTSGNLGTLGDFDIIGGIIEISPDEDEDPASGNITANVINLQSTQGIINAKYMLTLQGEGDLSDNIYGKKLDASEYVTATDGNATKYGTTVIDVDAKITLPSGKMLNNNVVVKGKLNNGGTIIGGVVVAADAELDAITNAGIIKNAEIQASVPIILPQILANQVINYGTLKAKADNIQGFEQVINTGILELKGPTTSSLKYEINEGGAMSHSGKTIIEGGCVSNAVNGDNGNKLIVQKEIEIRDGGQLETDADNLQISDRITNNVDNGLVLIDEGTLNTSVYGSGSTQIGKNADDVADVTMNGIFNQKVEIKEKSTLRIVANGLKADGNIDKGLLILGAGTLDKSVDGVNVGRIEYAGDVIVNKMPLNLKGMKIDDGVKVDFSNANNRTMTVSDVNIGSNTTMFLNAPTGVSVDRVDALNSNDAVINGVNTSFSTGSGNMLYLKNTVEKNKTYVVVGGTAVTGNERPWDLIETDNFDVELVYISDPKAFGEAKAGVVAFKALPAPSIIRDIDCDAPNVFTEMKNVLPVESDERQFLREINVTYRDEKQKGLDAWNSVASLNAVAGVTRNVLSSTTLALATVNEHLMTVKVPVQYGGYRSGRAALIDTVSDNFQGMIPEIIPGGDTQSVMPQRVTGRSSRAISRQSRSGGSSKKYQITSENQVWASYIQSKETIDGLKAGDATNNSEIKYKGASVGIDMWSTDKSIGGIYGSYVEGKVDANNSAAITRNEIDNYGVGIYNRLDYKFASVLIDAGYVHSKNDIRQENLGREITAKPKVDAYSAGIRIEKMCAAGSSTITPFIGVRYMNVQTQSYDNSMGIRHKIDDEDLFTIPVGLKWCADLNPDSKMRFRPSIEGGYNFNIGGRDNKQKISFNGVTDTVKFNALDKGNYFVRVGMEFVGSNTILGLFYKYSKGDHIKDNKFNVNLSFDF
ncbi:MAG: autotransporter outer membrane beta-barrel domain-containing protein, partial [Phascolarctobacterium sp.]|nr:autotransporter outer membrane beta-barrel domain-containing protein [Candidatus Phascolarctobacterium caballi]